LESAGEDRADFLLTSVWGVVLLEMLGVPVRLVRADVGAMVGAELLAANGVSPCLRRCSLPAPADSCISDVDGENGRVLLLAPRDHLGFIGGRLGDGVSARPLGISGINSGGATGLEERVAVLDGALLGLASGGLVSGMASRLETATSGAAFGMTSRLEAATSGRVCPCESATLPRPWLLLVVLLKS
jgi:hypothetical protein